MINPLHNSVNLSTYRKRVIAEKTVDIMIVVDVIDCVRKDSACLRCIMAYFPVIKHGDRRIKKTVKILIVLCLCTCQHPLSALKLHVRVRADNSISMQRQHFLCFVVMICDVSKQKAWCALTALIASKAPVLPSVFFVLLEKLGVLRGVPGLDAR